MPGKHDVYVFGDDVGFKVRPAVAPIIKSKWFRIRNCSGHDITVDFPPGLMTGATAAQLTILVGDGQRYLISAAANGVYSYGVKVTLAPGVTVPANGESGPRIIVDP